MKKIFILFIIATLLTGCYNYHELETLGVTSSILFDYVDNNYELTIEIIEEEKPKLFKGKGTTISDALDIALRSSGKMLSYFHLNTVIVTPNVDVKEILFYLMRNPQVNNTFYVVLAKEKDIFNEEEDTGKKINDILKRNKTDTFFELSKTLVDDKIDLVLPIIESDLSVTSMMPYSQFKLTKELEISDIQTYRMLEGENESLFKGRCPNSTDYFEISTNQAKTDIKIKDKISIDIDLEASISEFNCNLDTTDIKNIKILQDIINNTIKEKSHNFIGVLQQYKADIMGFNRLIYNNNHSLDKDWMKYEYEINVETHINKKGLILK